MNLIEQLGGYEKAKAFINATSYTVDELLMMQRSGLRSKHVEEDLLQYRREHGIFEVGDMVVHHTFRPQYVQEVKSVFGNYMEIYHHKKEYYYRVYCESFRHATDEEIEPGKRLEVG